MNNWYKDYSSRLDKLADLGKDWDSYGSDPPNKTAIQNAGSVLTVLLLLGKSPTRVAPIADGGVIIWLNKPDNIECSNDGRIILEVTRE